MGREIRRVPIHWQHPRKPDGDYQPLYDEDYETAARLWLMECVRWEYHWLEHGCGPEGCDTRYYWDWEGSSPEDTYYRPAWQPGTKMGFQMYETVTEGTPLSPVFPSKQLLADWLCTHTDWCGDGPRTREQAEMFVKDEWAPSAMIFPREGQIIPGIEAAPLLKRNT